MATTRSSGNVLGRSGSCASLPLILVVGTPGTGKRPIAGYLADEHGFVHVDLGERASREWLLGGSDTELREALEALAARSRGVILTWAAGSPEQLREVRRLRAAGVDLVWCDSDRGAALRAYYADAGRLPRFRFVDTFEPDGRFRPVEAVVTSLLHPAPRPKRRRRPSQRFMADLRFRLGTAGAALAGAAAVGAIALAGFNTGGAGRHTAAPVPQPVHHAALPKRGVLVEGRSLAGVQLGDTMAQVRRQWGGHFTRCGSCKPAMWFYLYAPPSDPVGAGVEFANGRVVAVFTLGSPSGWRTDDGIRVGQILNNPTSGRRWLSCAGYSAAPTQVSKASVTSILTQGAAVYGFSLTRPSISPCH